MADDRPIEDTVDQVGRLQRELDDLRSTVLARVTRRPTGDVEPTIRATAKDNTLLLNGAAVSRIDYAGLWAWANDNGLVIAGLFTVGDGANTFGLPDMRGRVPIGVGTLGADSYALGALIGAARVTLATTEMPSHTHTATTGNDNAAHQHYYETSSNGAHTGHGGGSGAAAAGSWAVLDGDPYSAGSHSHSGWTGDPDAAHQHPVTVTAAGGGGAHENRQPSIAINWLIWT